VRRNAGSRRRARVPISQPDAPILLQGLPRNGEFVRLTAGLAREYTGQDTMTRQALLVLGAHRSGTSALAGLLIRLGADGPKTPMGPNFDNPLGYGESKVLFEFHERLLRSAHTSWDAWTRIEPAWFQSAASVQFADELRRLVEQEYGGTALFMVKDPRVARFVPFWLRALDAENIVPKAIIAIRSPGEVAASLEARDGIAREQALLIWLRHVLDAELDTRVIPRSFVRYGDLLNDWKAVAARISADVGVEWSRTPEVTDAAMAAFLRRDLRHHTIGIEHLDVGSPLQAWVTRTCRALDLLLAPDDDGVSEALAALDDLRRDLDGEAALFGRFPERQRHELRERVAHLEAERQALQQQTVRLDTERIEHRTHVAALEAERDRLLRSIDGYEVERDRLTRNVARLEAERNDLEAERNDLRDQAIALEADRSGLRRQADDLEARNGHLAHELATATHRVDALLASGSWRITAPLRAVLRLFLRSQPPVPVRPVPGDPKHEP
jgi:hypothetical protein